MRLVPTTVLLITTLVIILGRIPSLDDPMGMDQAHFTLVAQGLTEGKAPYRDLFENNPPLIYFLYVPMYVYGGVSGAFQALGDMALCVIQNWLLYILLCRLASPRIAALSTITFAFLVLCPIWNGAVSYCQPESFVNLVLLAAFAILARPGLSRGVHYFVVGFGAAILTILKLMPFLLILPLGFFYGVIALPRPRDWCLFFLGIAIPGLPALGYVLLEPGMRCAWDAVIGFNRIYTPAVVNSLANAVGEKLWCLGLPVLLAVYGYLRTRTEYRQASRFLCGWIAFSAITIFIRNKFYYYHFLILIPPLAGASAFGADSLIESAYLGVGGRKRFMSGMVFLAILAVMGRFTLEYCQVHASCFRYHTGRITAAQLHESQWVAFGATALATEVAANYIRQCTHRGDEIHVWGINSWLHLLSDRRPFFRYPIHPVLLTSEAPYNRFGDAAGRRAEFIEKFRRSPPACFVVSRQDRSVFSRMDSYQLLVNDAAIYGLLRNEFQLAQRIRNMYIWVRKDRYLEAKRQNAI